MSGRTERVLRKARRVEQIDLDRSFNEGLAPIKQARDKALTAANADYNAAVNKARDEQMKTRNAAYKAYDEARDELLRRLGKEATA